MWNSKISLFFQMWIFKISLFFLAPSARALVSEIDFPAEGADDAWISLSTDIGLAPGADIEIKIQTTQPTTPAGLADAQVMLISHDEWDAWNDGEPFNLPDEGDKVELNSYMRSSWRAPLATGVLTSEAPPEEKRRFPPVWRDGRRQLMNVNDEVIDVNDEDNRTDSTDSVSARLRECPGSVLLDPLFLVLGREALTKEWRRLWSLDTGLLNNFLPYFVRRRRIQRSPGESRLSTCVNAEAKWMTEFRKLYAALANFFMGTENFRRREFRKLISSSEDKVIDDGHESTSTSKRILDFDPITILHAKFSLPTTAGRGSQLDDKRYSVGILNPRRLKLHLKVDIETVNPGNEGLGIQQFHLADVYGAVMLMNVS